MNQTESGRACVHYLTTHDGGDAQTGMRRLGDFGRARGGKGREFPLTTSTAPAPAMSRRSARLVLRPVCDDDNEGICFSLCPPNGCGTKNEGNHGERYRPTRVPVVEQLTCHAKRERKRAPLASHHTSASIPNTRCSVTQHPSHSPSLPTRGVACLAPHNNDEAAAAQQHDATHHGEQQQANSSSHSTCAWTGMSHHLTDTCVHCCYFRNKTIFICFMLNW